MELCAAGIFELYPKKTKARRTEKVQRKAAKAPRECPARFENAMLMKCN
jgi:hypothetical protein